MFTVNLEEALLKQNKNTSLLPEELLEIKEYERLGNDFCDNEIIDRLGLNEITKNGRERKEYAENIGEYLKTFNPEKVFHKSQIKKLCTKYRLRFLPVSRYKGAIDKGLISKVSNFEIAYDVSCDKKSCYIAAPKSSFRLEARPKDPLFFYEINEEYYYLIHKWGNDLSLFRKIKVNKIAAVILFLIGIKFLIKSVLYIINEWSKPYSMGGPDALLCSIVSIVGIVGLIALFTSHDNNWDSNTE